MGSGKNFDKLCSTAHFSLVLWENPKQHEYVRLIIRRDILRREAVSIGVRYHKLFGDILLDLEREVLEYVKLGVLIEFYQKAINRGEKVDAEELERYVGEKTRENQKKYEDTFANVVMARFSLEVPKEVVEETKTIYRRLAKLIHPDFNPKASEDSRIKALWGQIQEAYEEFDTERLGELEILVNKVLVDTTGTSVKIDVPDVDDKIKKLHREIVKIITTEPYKLIDAIAPEENVEVERERLEKMLTMYHSMRIGREEILEEKKREVENE